MLHHITFSNPSQNIFFYTLQHSGKSMKFSYKNLSQLSRGYSEVHWFPNWRIITLSIHPSSLSSHINKIWSSSLSRGSRENREKLSELIHVSSLRKGSSERIHTLELAYHLAYYYSPSKVQLAYRPSIHSANYYRPNGSIILLFPLFIAHHAVPCMRPRHFLSIGLMQLFLFYADISNPTGLLILSITLLHTV